MGQGGLDRHQLAGLDHRERGFSRPVEFERAGEHYRAILRYETTRVCTEPYPTQDVALLTLIQTLHAQGYRQLRTQVSFRNGIYLGSQEMWIEYPDPPQLKAERSGFMARLLSWFRPRTAHG
ncbi:MAG: hypothetical protein HY038_12960 [Nitrospirae bacterium]|nr:hypothetical protein [Nitrospirota bacterium]